MVNRTRAHLGLASILVALVGAVAVGACSDDDDNTGGNGGAGAGGKAGSAGAAGKGGAGGGAGVVVSGGSAGETEAGQGGSVEAGAGGEGGLSAGAGGADDGSAGEGGAGPVLPCGPTLAKPTGVPANIVVKDSATLVAAYAAEGVQTYTCTATTVNTTTTYAWSAPVPTANLYGQSCTLAGTHYAGPHWKANDGSILVGTRIRDAASTTANSIPQLVLSAAVDAGVAGVLTPVTAIQRLHTVGGTAPTTACSAANVNATAPIPYTADYYFYSGADIIPPAPTTL